MNPREAVKQDLERRVMLAEKEVTDQTARSARERAALALWTAVGDPQECDRAETEYQLATQLIEQWQADIKQLRQALAVLDRLTDAQLGIA